MRLSLSTEPSIGTCSKCGNDNAAVLTFSVVADGHSGDVAPLCSVCLFEEGARSDVPMQELAPGPAPRRKALRHNKRISQQQERDIAEELGARVQPNSGAMSGAKGDVRKRGAFRLEAKFTRAESFALHLEDLEKIAGECAPSERPLLVIDFLEQGTSKLRDRFAVLHFQDTKELLNASGQHR